MPTHNCASYLREAIESILAQTFAEFEFVIVDDGSSDQTSSILAEYEERDGRIRILRNKENLGIVASLNAGLDACRSEYVVRMDADDVASPDRLARQLAWLEAHPEVAVLGGAVAYINELGQDLGVIRYCRVGASLIASNPLLHPTAVLRRAVLARHSIRYRERYRYAEDYFLWLEVSRVAELGAMDEVVLKYRLHSGASRMTHLKKMMRAALRVKKDAILRLRIHPAVTDMLRMWLEATLLLLPASLIRWTHRRFILRVNG